MKIYLATPYTATNKKILQFRIDSINQMAVNLIKQHHIVYSPITHWHHIALEYKLPMEENYWRDQNIAFIKWCDAMVINTIPGWASSKGVLYEIQKAKEYKKSIYSYSRFKIQNKIIKRN
jgi:hypothetical protein